MSQASPALHFASSRPPARPPASGPSSAPRFIPAFTANSVNTRPFQQQNRPAVQGQVQARPTFRPNVNIPPPIKRDDLFARSRVPPPTPHDAAHGVGAGAERRKKEEGMRGTMRNEIARLMYGAGDVAEPDVDTVDYMEDMVVEFVADLCRPVPPIRATPSVPHQPVTLSSEILRHRLSSTPMLHKYLERFDHMVYMSDVLKAHRRITAPNMTDLIEQVGNDYLGLNENGAPVGGDSAAQAGYGQKRAAEGDRDEPPRKKGRPPKPPGERKKPGPQKGWKLNKESGVVTPKVKKDPNAPKRKYVRKAPLKSQMGSRAGTPTATGGN